MATLKKLEVEANEPAVGLSYDDREVFTDDTSHSIKYRTLSWPGAAVIMITEIVTGGTLTLPQAIAVVGLVPGIIIIIFCGIWALFTSFLLIDFKLNHPEVHNMGDAGFILFSPFGLGAVGREVLSAGTLLFAVSGVGTMCLLGQLALQTLGENGLCAMSYLGIWTCITFLVSIPRTFGAGLQGFSAAACISVLLATLVAMIGSGVEPTPGRVVVATAPNTFYTAFLAITNPVLAYAGHFLFFTIISEMKVPRDAKKSAWVLQIFSTTWRISPSISSANANLPEPRSAQRQPTSTDLRDLEPHPALRISRRQHFAILYAIEEAIRSPYTFTPVLEEEQEQMSDLMGDSTQGGGRSAPSIRTPRNIMADRLAREARRHAEATRQREGEQRSSDPERRRAAAAAMESMAGPDPAPSSTRMSKDPRSDIPTRQRSQSQSAQPGSKAQTLPGHRRTQTTSQPGQRVSSAPDPPQTTQSQDIGPEDVPQPGTHSSFPHAFERWENLSSHWEGLTSYWLRKIEANSEEIRHIIPSAASLQRQIQDLSAAGANLFHGLVELQRLRASSERKFKRWFFEMRAEQEKWQELRADLVGQVNSERELKEQAERTIEKMRKEVLFEKNRANEDRRELLIAKAEARRAWESLGDMEAKNSEIMTNLRQGIPTNIGGIQVVPTHAASTQDTERRPTIGQSPQYHQTRSQQPQQTHHVQQQYQPIVPDIQYQDDEPSPTNTDPFTESARAGQPLHHEPDMQQLESEMRQPYPSGSTPASTSTGRTAISPHQQRRDMSPHELSPLSPNVTTTRPVIQPSQAATDTLSDQPELFYQQPPGKVYLHSSPGSGAARSKTPVAEAVQGHDLGSRPSYESDTTEGTEYELDEHGAVRRDAQGRPVVYRNPNRGAAQTTSHVSSEDYDTAADVAHERELATRYGVGMPPSQIPRAPTSSAEAMASFATSTADDVESAGYRDVEPADYEGAGYGSDWEALQSRHHHPTRLSDVLEEDERSRTTADLDGVTFDNPTTKIDEDDNSSDEEEIIFRPRSSDKLD
ncbi:hypothetical protein QM012_000363 [Aureobasidium pullulans]|uniref:Amino acid transporter transmembrane domain-containing protein n=1 Tax=Aureobasidium pullulans TaxID=5580 RepID=A0ABR0TVH0_AURPU